MKLVGAAANRRIDYRAARPAILRRKVIRLHLKFLHRIRRKLHHLIRETLIRCAIGVIIYAIHHEVIQRAPQAVHIKRRIAIRNVRLSHARRQQRQVGICATIQRQVDDRLASDHLATVARVRLKLVRRATHGDALGDVAHFQCKVDALPCIHHQREHFRIRLLEA